MQLQETDIEAYLTEAKNAVYEGRYRLERNFRRKKNRDLFINYVIDEQKTKEILMSLTAQDFSDVVQNEHAGYEHEQLYIFGKDVMLMERFGSRIKKVPLYIKFNKLDSKIVIVISFHEQKHPLTYYFK
ncbi:MAG: hypothetical protein Q4C77_09595 [Eubacteriales bacterium]|nr:hypothetical protein [Eubacteriales bacterium]